MSTPLDNIDDFFEEDEAQASKDEWIANKKARFEDLVVRKIYKFFNIPTTRFNPLKANYLSFSQFHSEFPSFPIRLCSYSIGLMRDVTIVDLYNRFTSTRLFKEFTEARNDLEEDCNCWGLVFPWIGMDAGVIHNSTISVTTPARFTRHIANAPNGIPNIHLDKFKDFLAGIQQIWTAHADNTQFTN